jgi:hypothetical protein
MEENSDLSVEGEGWRIECKIVRNWTESGMAFVSSGLNEDKVLVDSEEPECESSLGFNCTKRKNVKCQRRDVSGRSIGNLELKISR